MIDLDMISHCADRYRVSLIAAISRWLEYTERRAIVVVSRDGYILWSQASAAARKTGAFFRTSADPVEIPVDSPAAKHELLAEGRGSFLHPAGVWLPEEVSKMTLFAEHYDFAVHYCNWKIGTVIAPPEPSADEDAYDRLSAGHS